MMNTLVFLSFLGLLFLGVGGEQIIRCDLSPVNICGSDSVIYGSECEFLIAKHKNGDLTIQDLGDCVKLSSPSEEGNSTDVISYGGRSLRGDRMQGLGSGGGAIVRGVGSEDDDLDAPVSSSLNETFLKAHQFMSDGGDMNMTQSSRVVSPLEGGGMVGYVDEFSQRDDRVFKNITKYNVKIVNVVVEKFDISTFILSDGRYNLSRLSLSVLDAVLRILRRHRLRIKGHFGRKDGEGSQTESVAVSESNSTKVVESGKMQRSDMNVIDNCGIGELNGLNVTFKLTNLANETVPYPGAFRLALQSIGRMGILPDVRGLLVPETGEGNSTSGLIGEPWLGQSVNESSVLLGSVSNNTFTSGPCGIAAPESGDEGISQFQCSFAPRSGGFSSNSKSFLETAEATLRMYLQNVVGPDNFYGYPFSSWNTSLVNSNKTEGGSGVAERRLQFGDNTTFVDSDIGPYTGFPNVEISSNSTDDDLGIDKLFVNFEMDQKPSELGDYIEGDVLESGEKLLEEMTKILDETLFDGKELTSEPIKVQRDEEGRTLDIPTPLRISDGGEHSKDETGKGGENSLREFPPAFDRVRGEKCVVECRQEEDFHCGSNGVTYKNLCEFRNAQCNNTGLVFVSYGECSPLFIRS